MKKWLVFLLALVVIAGATFPCCPADDCQDELITTSEEVPDEKGGCSPFFACATCAGFAQTAKHVYMPLPIAQTANHHEATASSFISAYYPSFFQPPRAYQFDHA